MAAFSSKVGLSPHLFLSLATAAVALWYFQRNRKRIQKPQEESETSTKKFAFADDEVRWGIIGVGDVCEVKAGPGFYKSRHSRLVAVMRRTLSLAQDFALRHQVPKAYGTVEELLNDPEVNAVYIATPVKGHLQIALQAARAGKPTLVEKPMARNSAEARQMHEAFQQAGVPLWIAYYRRALPIFREVREMILSGEIGPVRHVSYHAIFEVGDDIVEYQRTGDHSKLGWRLDQEEAGGGLFMDVGSHAVDLLQFLFGDIQVTSRSTGVSSLYEGLGVEDFVQFEFSSTQPNPFIGHCEWEFSAAKGRGKRELMRIVTDNKIFEFKPLGVSDVVIKTWGTSGKITEHTFRSEVPEHVHQNLIQSCVNELLGSQYGSSGKGINALCPCPSTSRSGSRTTELLDIIQGNH